MRKKRGKRKNEKKRSFSLFPLFCRFWFSILLFSSIFPFFSRFGFSPRVIIAVGAGSAWGFYFLFYNSGKSFLQGGDPKLQLSPAAHLATASMVGGEIFRCVRNIGEWGYSWSITLVPFSFT